MIKLKRETFHNTAVLVLSCDKYRDVWPTFFAFFFKYWPDCPYRIYLASNIETFKDKRITPLHSSVISDWSAETAIILNQIPEKYLIVILEDYFIYKPVDAQLIDRVLTYMEQNNGVYCRIACMPSKLNRYWQFESVKENNYLGKIKKEQLYRINLQISIWDREYMKSLLKSGENAWSFEINGSIRSDKSDCNFYCIRETPRVKHVHGPITYFCTAVSRGVWMKDAVRLCRKEKIFVDLSKRRIENQVEYLFRKIYISSPLFMRRYLDFIKNRILFTFIKV